MCVDRTITKRIVGFRIVWIDDKGDGAQWGAGGWEGGDARGRALSRWEYSTVALTTLRFAMALSSMTTFGSNIF